MTLLKTVLAVAMLGACGGPPLLQNVPRPNTAAVAGIAAGTAAALTLADPQGAAARQEARKPEKNLQPTKSRANVPADVLDRLDEKQKRGGPGEATAAPETAATAPATATDTDTDTATDTAPPDETTGVVSPIPLK